VACSSCQTNSVIDGPEQIFKLVRYDAAISKDINLLGSGGSQVIEGNLLTLPIGNSFLCVEPRCVQGAASNGRAVVARPPVRNDRIRGGVRANSPV
jgi:uncharacterized protein